MTLSRVSVAVIGGGPAGIAAAIAASSDGASTILIERERRLGGKLNQSIHNGFGFNRFEEPLTGPEYAYNDILELEQTNTVVLLQTSVTAIERMGSGFQLTLSSRHGMSIVEANSIVLAQGCRERTPYEHGIFGTHPSGVFTAGQAQYMLNVMGQMPVQNSIVMGTGNLALQTTRALAQSGAKILGVYEPTSAPVGYLDYVSRCIYEMEIPIYFNHSITRVFGNYRVRAVEVARSDMSGNPIRGSEGGYRCNGLIISGDLVPLTNLAASMEVALDPKLKTPLSDHNNMTSVDGIFAAGSGQHMSDLVDYVTESGVIAGRGAARYMFRERRLVELIYSNDILTVTPRYIDIDIFDGTLVMFFNPALAQTNAYVCVVVDNNEIFAEKFDSLKPSETQRVEVNFGEILTAESTVAVRIERRG